MTLLDEIADAVAAVDAAHVSPDDRAAAQRCVLDTVACGLAGSARPAAHRLRSALAADDPGSSTVIGSQAGLRRPAALLANAAAIRLLDFNDIYAGRNNLHPSETVVPLVLAHAEAHGWSGRAFLDAVVCGYRIYLGIGELWQGLLGRGWAPTATLGQLAAAAFAGWLSELDHERMVHGMALAAINAPALGVVFKGAMSDGKNLVNGLATAAGWQASRLARGDVTGPRDVLEGPAGFGEQAAGGVDRSSFGAWERLGPRLAWLKPYPTVFHIHAAIQAAIELHGQIDDVGSVERVEVRVSERALAVAGRADRWEPANPEAAQFSLPYCVCRALAHGDCGVEAFTHSAVADPTVGRLLSRLTASPDDRWTGYRGAEVVVEHAGGPVLRRTVDGPYGHPDNPMSDDHMRAKASALLDSCVGRPARDHTLLVCDALPRAPDLDGLLACLRGQREVVG